MPSDPILDERIRDPHLISTIADEGLSEEVVSQIFLETLRQFFMNPDNFSVRRMRDRNPPLVWSPKEEETKVRILRDIDWVPENMGQTPEIIIRSQGTEWQAINNQAGIDDYYISGEAPDRIGSMVTGRIVVWSISPSGEESRMIGWELGTFFDAFSQPFCREWGFYTVRPAGVGGPARIRERKGYWGTPLVIGYQWQLSQEVTEQKPVLAEIKTRTTY